jgi:hypothetical protein
VATTLAYRRRHGKSPKTRNEILPPVKEWHMPYLQGLKIEKPREAGRTSTGEGDRNPSGLGIESLLLCNYPYVTPSLDFQFSDFSRTASDIIMIYRRALILYRRSCTQ